MFLWILKWEVHGACLTNRIKMIKIVTNHLKQLVKAGRFVPGVLRQNSAQYETLIENFFFSQIF